MKTAFTLVEVVLIVVILSILSYLFRATYLNIVKKSKISVSRQNLNLLQRQVALFKEREGYYPPNFDVLISSGYIQKIPEIVLPYHIKSNEVIISSNSYNGVGDTGKWYYNPNLGEVSIDCTHTDLDGVVISNW